MELYVAPAVSGEKRGSQHDAGVRPSRLSSHVMVKQARNPLHSTLFKMHLRVPLALMLTVTAALPSPLSHSR
jgi:hypothetical protein